MKPSEERQAVRAGPPRDSREKSYTALVDQGIVSGTNFLTGLVLARFLGAEGYGQFVLAFGLLLFLVSIHMALVISPMMVLGARISHDRSNSYFRAIASQQVLFSIGSGLIVWAIASLSAFIVPSWRLDALILPLSMAVVAFTAQETLRRYFFVRNAWRAALANDIIRYALQLAFLIVLGVQSALDVEATLWVIAGTAALAAAMGTLHPISHSLRKPAFALTPEFRTSHIQHWQFGKWLAARNVVYWFGTQLLIYMSGALLSVAAVGAMTAARNILGVANILFLAMENFAPSRASAAFDRHGAEGLSSYLRRIGRIGGLMTLAIVLVASLFPGFWLELFYGEAYAGYESLVLWWGAFTLIGFFHRPLGAGLRALGHTRSIFSATLSGTLTALFVGYPLIELVGITGAMIALVAVQTVILLALTASFRSRIRGNPSDAST